VAFAIGRAIGSSVVRNRVRRRLRAVLSATQPSATQPSATQLPPGWYLIGARPGIVALSFAQLTGEVSGLVASVERQLSRPAVGSSDS
jgi:ribonuclease P protein component